MGERKASNSQFKANYDLVSRKPSAPAVVVRPTGSCKANEDTCKAYAKKGGDLCAGHAASEKKRAEAVDESE
jgi:hypothetical protein